MVALPAVVAVAVAHCMVHDWTAHDWTAHQSGVGCGFGGHHDAGWDCDGGRDAGCDCHHDGHDEGFGCCHGAAAANDHHRGVDRGHRGHAAVCHDYHQLGASCARHSADCSWRRWCRD